MTRAVREDLRSAGWRILTQRGWIVNALVPRDARIPRSPYIWSVSFGARVGTDTTPPTGQGGTTGSSGLLAAYGFQSPPVGITTATAPNGDIVFAASFNVNWARQIPAGLPVTLLIGAEDAAGNVVPVSVTSVASSGGIVSYVTSGSSDSPGFGLTQANLWALEFTADEPLSAGHVLTLTLSDGAVLPVSLPAFTGSATALSRLTGPELADLSGASTLTPNAPSGPSIAIFAYGAVPSEQDLASLLATEDLPDPHVQDLYEDGASPDMASNPEDAMEVNEDLQAVASVAPGANLVEYVYPPNDPNDALLEMLTALSENPGPVRVATISYGWYDPDPSALVAAADACAAEGITVIVASGDQGAYAGSGGSVGVADLDSDPTVLSVGGLVLAAPAVLNGPGDGPTMTGEPIAAAWGGDFIEALSPTAQQAYLAPNEASTGGYGSAPVPTWEAWALPPTATGNGVPVIANLAGMPGLLGISSGQEIGLGGTSLSAPVTAALLTDLEGTLHLDGLGALPPQIFRVAQEDPGLFTQAQWGSNGAYAVTSSVSGSWNPVTGFGLLDWGGLAQVLASGTSPPSLRPYQVEITINGSFDIIQLPTMPAGTYRLVESVVLNGVTVTLPPVTVTVTSTGQVTLGT